MKLKSPHILAEVVSIATMDGRGLEPESFDKFSAVLSIGSRNFAAHLRLESNLIPGTTTTIPIIFDDSVAASELFIEGAEFSIADRGYNGKGRVTKVLPVVQTPASIEIPDAIDQVNIAAPEESLSKSARAKNIANAAHILVMVIFAWAFIYPRPYYPLVLFFLLLPWMAIATAWISKGLYTVGYSGKNTENANLTLFFILSPILLAVRASRDLDNFYWTQAIIPGIVVGILMTLIVGLMSAWFARSLRIGLLYAILCCVYGTNAIVLINTFCDYSVPIVYPR
jgi:hypothetical protein